MASTPRISALDGLRGFALMGMLAWHAQLSWVKGGFARMTVFFVLSGYLAAKSLLRTTESSSGRGFVRYYGRRARRLLPITFVGVAFALFVTAGWGSPSARANSFGDTLSVLTSWSNWRFILEDRPYGALFESPSAFQHYWSLSVEEQCLIVLPLIVAIVLPLVAWTRRKANGRAPRDAVAHFSGVDDPGFAAVIAMLGVVAAAVPLFVVMEPDTAYYGTHVRIGEFLLGVAFALWWRRADRVASPRAARWWGWSGLVGLASLVVVMLSIDRTAGWVYRGGMGMMSIPVIAVMGGVLAQGPWVTAVLSFRPLVWMGRAAFSIYVIHWPIFQIFEVELAGRGRGVIVTVELIVSLVVGYALHRWVEKPLLPGAETAAARTWAKPKVAFSGAAIGLVVCLGAATVVPQEEPEIDFARLSEDRSLAVEPISVEDAQRVLTDGVSMGTEFPVFRDPSLVGVGLFGGSTALTLALGSDGWTPDPVWAQAVPGYAPLGCGVLDTGERAGGSDPGNRLPEGPVPPECSQRSLRWAATVRAYAIQVPVVVASSADLTTWRFASGDDWSTIGSQAVDSRLADGLVDAIDAMARAGAKRVVLTTPMSPRRDETASVIVERRRRNDRYRELLSGIAATRDVAIVDLEAWSAALSDDEFRELVPDGIHLSEPGAARAWLEVLGPELERIRSSP